MLYIPFYNILSIYLHINTRTRFSRRDSSGRANEVAHNSLLGMCCVFTCVIPLESASAIRSFLPGCLSSKWNIAMLGRYYSVILRREVNRLTCQMNLLKMFFRAVSCACAPYIHYYYTLTHACRVIVRALFIAITGCSDYSLTEYPLCI